MNWDVLQGKWQELKGTLKSKWAKLTDDDWKEGFGLKFFAHVRLARAYLLRHPRVVQGDLSDFIIPNQVGAAVPHLPDIDPILHYDRYRERGSHAAALINRLRHAVNCIVCGSN